MGDNSFNEQQIAPGYQFLIEDRYVKILKYKVLILVLDHKRQFKKNSATRIENLSEEAFVRHSFINLGI